VHAEVQAPLTAEWRGFVRSYCPSLPTSTTPGGVQPRAPLAFRPLRELERKTGIPRSLKFRNASRRPAVLGDCRPFIFTDGSFASARLRLPLMLLPARWAIASEPLFSFPPYEGTCSVPDLLRTYGGSMSPHAPRTYPSSSKARVFNLTGVRSTPGPLEAPPARACEVPPT